MGSLVIAVFILLVAGSSSASGAPAEAGPDSSAADTAAIARPAPADSAGRTPSDSIGHRIVREFPPVQVRGLLEDLRSTETVHPIAPQVMRQLPIDDFADLVALQPGVVTQGDE